MPAHLSHIIDTTLPSRMVGLETFIFLAPPIIGLSADPDPPTRLCSRRALRQNDFSLIQPKSGQITHIPAILSG